MKRSTALWSAVALLGIPTALILLLLWCELLIGYEAPQGGRWFVAVIGMVGGLIGALVVVGEQDVPR